MDSLNASPRLLDAHVEPAVKRRFTCRCGKPIFFRNTQCLACGSQLGFDPVRLDLLALEPGDAPDTWRVQGEEGPGRYIRCANFHTASACNWLVEPAIAPAQATDGAPLAPPVYCTACALNHLVPDLTDPQAAKLWAKLELAKRRLVSGLLALGLPIRSRCWDDPVAGVMFDFIAHTDDGARAMTGHADGLITINLAEADDVQRERMRTAMHEPYRTLLGHLRHEIGHYYWDRLVAGTPWLEGFRHLFGDERADYAAALQQHYDHGAPPDWPEHFVSAYASMHPWEDWAETWAHYLHMVDTYETAMDFGLKIEDVDMEYSDFKLEDLYDPNAQDSQPFLDFLNQFTRLSGVLNELSRSMGQKDFYPFVLPRAIVAKLQFIHLVVAQARLDRN